MKPRLAAISPTVAAAVVAAGALVALGCPAVYPELGTRTHPIPAGQPLDPGPPPDLRWMKFVSARVPDRTRDGRPWGPSGKASPYAKVLVNGVELFRTPPESNTLEPTWPGAPRGNFKLAPADRLRIELWDSDPLNDKPIGASDVGVPGDQALLDKQVRVTFDDGGEVVLAFEPAHAVRGLGLWYELRTQSCGITRLLEGSPAERAGLQPGDDLLTIGTRQVSAMSPEELKSAFNAVPLEGLAVSVKHPGGVVAQVALKEGPIYPTFSQFGPVD
jgi:hypothetical protein